MEEVMKTIAELVELSGGTVSLERLASCLENHEYDDVERLASCLENHEYDDVDRLYIDHETNGGE